MGEAENQINDLEHKESKNNQSEQQEEKRIQKMRVVLATCRTNFKRSNIHIIGVPEGKEKEQEIVNQFEKVMEGNFPNLVKEIDIQVQES